MKNQAITQKPPRPPSLIKSIYLAKFLDFIRTICRGNRLTNLFHAVEVVIINLKPKIGSEIHLLDYGCGVMEISTQLKKNGVVNDFIGVDVFEMPSVEASQDERWTHYRSLQGGEEAINELPNEFNLTIVIDVLHHIIEDTQKIRALQTLAMISPYILVKDHLETGFFSRQILRLADWFGNYSYDVRIPNKYFTRESWKRLINEANLNEIVFLDRVKVHTGLFGVLVPPTRHFISVLIPSSDKKSI
jgi:hypothetical protein